MPQISTADWWRPEPLVEVARTSAAPARAAHSTSSRIAFASLAAFMAVLVATPQEFLPALVPLHLARLTALAALAAYLLHRVHHGAPAGPTPRAMLWLALLVGWAVCTVPLSIWPGGSVALLTELYLKAVLVCWLLAAVLTTVARLRTMMWVLCLSTVPLAATAIVGFAGGGADRIAGYGEGLGGNPNDLALVLAITMPLSGALAAVSRGATRAIAVALVPLAIAGIVATYSRGGFLALTVVLAFGLLALARRRALGTIVATLLTGAALAALTPATYVDRVATVTDIDADPTGSAQERWRDIRAAASYVRDHPLIGAGVGMDILVLNDLRGPTWRTVHNSYLNYGVDLGLPGLTLFLLLLVSVIATARRVERGDTRRGADRELVMLAAGLRIALLAFAVAALVYPVAYHFYFYVLAGLAVAAGRIGGPTTTRSVFR